MEAKEMFMSALLHLVETTKKISQKDIAESSGIAAQTISNFVRGHKSPGLDNQERIAQACGYNLIEFLTLGKNLIEGVPETTEQNNHGAVQISPPVSGMFGTADVCAETMSVVTNMVHEYRSLEREVRFWSATFEAMADAVCIIRDGIVVKQNQKSKAWGIKIGAPLCLNCAEGMCEITCKGSTCAIRESENLGTAAKRFKDTPWGKAIVTSSPVISEGAVFYVVTFTLIEESPATVLERRDA